MYFCTPNPMDIIKSDHKLLPFQYQISIQCESTEIKLFVEGKNNRRNICMKLNKKSIFTVREFIFYVGENIYFNIIELITVIGVYGVNLGR